MYFYIKLRIDFLYRKKKGSLMKLKLQISLITFCIWGSAFSATGASQISSDMKKSEIIKKWVDQFYHASQFNLFSRTEGRHPHCEEPIYPSCTDVACEKLGPYGCDTLSEIKQVGTSCRGNPNGNCLSTVCDKLGTFGCDTETEITEVARACVGNSETDCYVSVCERLGRFGCDSLSEVKEVLKACSGN